MYLNSRHNYKQYNIYIFYVRLYIYAYTSRKQDEPTNATDKHIQSSNLTRLNVLRQTCSYPLNRGAQGPICSAITHDDDDRVPRSGRSGHTRATYEPHKNELLCASCLDSFAFTFAFVVCEQARPLEKPVDRSTKKSRIEERRKWERERQREEEKGRKIVERKRRRRRWRERRRRRREASSLDRARLAIRAITLYLITIPILRHEYPHARMYISADPSRVENEPWIIYWDWNSARSLGR